MTEPKKQRALRFDRPKRLVRKSDFERAFRQGSRARGSILLVVARPNDLQVTRLGLSVGKVIWKSAVKRNRVRRIFREAFRLSYPDLPVGLDLVLVPAASKLVPEIEATRAELVSLTRKALRRCQERQERELAFDAERAPDSKRPERAERPNPAGESA